MKVCSNCFRDIEIQQFILFHGINGQCKYCGDNKESTIIDISELSDFFIEFIRLFRSDEDGKPLLEIIQQDWDFFTENDGGQKILDDLLREFKFEIDSSNKKVTYLNDIIDCVQYWEEFKEIIKWETRFLTNIEKLEELHWDQLFQRTVLLKYPERLYRARIHSNDNQTEFKREEMGSPMKERSSAGRANPQGIPFLYLSKSRETTLYEVRASYLDEVSVGTYDIREDCMLNIIDFTESVSLFEGTDIELAEQVKSLLLKRLISRDLSKPIRRYDSELDYIPTQFICEYIKYLYEADGIMFDSSLHQGGKNIVLFNQNKVECKEVQKCGIIEVNIISTDLD